MPLESFAIRHFDDNQFTEADPEFKLRIEKLYDTSPEFDSGNNAIELFEKSFGKNGILYVGMFNGKPIACVGSFDEGVETKRLLNYIVVHPANRGRGIAAKFIKQVADLERKRGVTSFTAGCPAIHRILTMYELM